MDIGPRQLRERFAEPFAAVIRDADIAAVRLGSHSVDGLVPSAEPQLLQEMLREELGFEGVVVSDAALLRQLIETHHLAGSKRQAAARALRAGVDAQLPDSHFFEEPLALALKDELLESGDINTAVRRVLRLKFRLGLFDAVLVDDRSQAPAVGRTAQRQFARKLVAQSAVLLANDGALPLQATVAQVNAESSMVLSTTASAICLIDCVADETSISAGRDRASAASEQVTLEQELRGRIGDRVNCLTLEAKPDTKSAQQTVSQLVDAACAADVVLVCLGTAGVKGGVAESDQQSNSGGLPEEQLELLRALATTDAVIVGIVFGGLFDELPMLVEQSNAVLLAWLPGVAGGEALADLLLGEANPAGRLPVAFPRGAAEPLFPFGFGLSYSEFSYDNLQCPETVDTHGVLRLAFDVTNRSAYAADEVVQIYATDQVATVRRPAQQLIGFNRISLAAGESLTCKFRIDPSQLSYFDGAMALSIEPGAVRLSIGGCAADARLTAAFRITGPQRKLSQRQIVATQVTGP